jgi:hypothetical protein
LLHKRCLSASMGNVRCRDDGMHPVANVLAFRASSFGLRAEFTQESRRKR